MEAGRTSTENFLKNFGIEIRADALRKAAPECAAEIDAALNRLTASDQMGELFKVVEVSSRKGE